MDETAPRRIGCFASFELCRPTARASLHTRQGALRGSKAFGVSLATVVAVRAKADLMPAAIAAGVAWAGLAVRPGVPASYSTAARWASGVQEAGAPGMVSAGFAAVGVAVQLPGGSVILTP
jgi:hypothetical protein